MASEKEIKAVRLEKIAVLKAAGMQPYPESVPRDMSLVDLRDQFESLVDTEEGTSISIAGRVMAIRGGGALQFVVLRDGSADFQVVLKRDELEEDVLKLFKDTVDIGDFISVTGKLFRTKTDEPSVQMSAWVMASKSLLPLPEKWHGIADDDDRQRKRYLEILMDSETYDRFALRSKVVWEIRKYFQDLGFMEVETPVLQNQAGGAMAETFGTHHKDYDMDMVLRISLEIEHKMIMAGGYPRIFEIGKNFRNEGSDPTHLQEFTMMEWYAAHATLEDNIQWTEELLKHLAVNIVGTTEFTVYDRNGEGTEVSFAGEWPKRRFADLLHEHAGVDMFTISEEDLREKVRELGMPGQDSEKVGRGTLLDYVFKRTARPTLVNPTFVLDYPGELKPLAQQNDDGTARVTQLVIGGAEITNQYAELVDPVQQRKLLELQSDARKAGDAEAMEVDDAFLTAMEYGLPPMTGFGMGIDRLVSIFTSRKNLRDTIFFPIMKKEEK